MKIVENFEEIKAWEIARKLDKTIFELTCKESFSNDYTLKYQIRKSSGKIMDNIADGFEKKDKNDFIRLLYGSKSSAAEVKSQLYRAIDRDYITNKEFFDSYEKCAEVSKTIMRLISHLLCSN